MTESAGAPLPVFETRLIAYVDLLGWTELIRSPRDSEDVMRKIFAGTSNLEAAIWSEGQRREEFAENELPFGKSIAISYFSDTIVYSCLPDPGEASWVAFQVQRLCGNLLARGHYTRGAITIGDLLHDRSNGTIVGRALIDAYDIEQSVAKVPSRDRCRQRQEFACRSAHDPGRRARPVAVRDRP